MALTCTGFGTKLSSAGLTYKHYGKRIVAQLMGDLPVDHPDVQTVYLATYKNFMEAIDAIDNGMSQANLDSSELRWFPQHHTVLPVKILPMHL